MIPSPSGLSVSNSPIGKPQRLSAIRRASELLKLASNSDRLKLLLLLEREDRTVTALAGQFPGQIDQFVSRHLGLLRRGGLAECRGVGAFRVYTLTEIGRGLLRAIGGAGGN